MDRSKDSGPSLTSSSSRWAAVLALATALAACGRGATEPYKPGLGELMTFTQMRHAKLWLAGRAGNWPLAAYELGELKEGFDDAVAYHPTHKDAPAPISELLPRIMSAPLEELGQAIDAKDGARFAVAFDVLTAGCNACHEATRFEYNVVTRPTGNPYGNQDFAPVAAPAGKRAS